MAEIQQKSPGADQGEAHPSGDNRFQMLDASMKRHRFQPDALIEVLHVAQELFGYLQTIPAIHRPRAEASPLPGLRRRDLLPLLHLGPKGSTPALFAWALRAT